MAKLPTQQVNGHNVFTVTQIAPFLSLLLAVKGGEGLDKLHQRIQSEVKKYCNLDDKAIVPCEQPKGLGEGHL